VVFLDSQPANTSAAEFFVATCGFFYDFLIGKHAEVVTQAIDELLREFAAVFFGETQGGAGDLGVEHGVGDTRCGPKIKRRAVARSPSPLELEARPQNALPSFSG